METSLNSKLLDFQKKINVIKKDGKNPHFGNKYATLGQILSEVKPLLSELGIVLLQPVKDNKVYTVLIDSVSGTTHESAVELPTGLTPQNLGSAITYFRRYTLSGILSLEIDDDDGQAASVPQNGAVKQTKPYLNENSEAYQKAVEALAAGTVTIQQIEAKYNLSKTVRETLMSQAI